jgi:hypothetical protein
VNSGPKEAECGKFEFNFKYFTLFSLRFGKRGSKDMAALEGEIIEPFYTPDRFLWLQ